MEAVRRDLGNGFRGCDSFVFRRARASWWNKLGLKCLARLFRGLSAVPPTVKPLLETPFLCAPQLSSFEELDVAQNRLALFAQPDEHAPVRAVVRARAGRESRRWFADGFAYA